MVLGRFLANGNPDGRVAKTYGMRIARQHRLDTVSGNLSQVGIIDSYGPQMGDIGVATLVRADI